MTDFELYVSNTAQLAAVLHDASVDGAELILCVGVMTGTPNEGRPVVYISSRLRGDFDYRGLLAHLASSTPEMYGPGYRRADDEPRPVSPTRGGICLICGEPHGAGEPCGTAHGG